MTAFQLFALFLALVALGGWLNARTVQAPPSVAMLLVGLAGALALAGLQRMDPTVSAAQAVIRAVGRLDFGQAVLGYMLAFLLFAGAMQVDLRQLRRQWLSIWSLATVGVAASTLIVGVGVWLAARGLGVPLALAWALVFGALISPTDPIAVLATVKRGGLSARLQVVLQGEALFNDGVGIVVFSAMVALAGGGGATPLASLGEVLVKAVGGLALGVISGWLVVRIMRTVQDHVVEVSLSLALAAGAYAGAEALHLSGAIAVVGAGLLIGDIRRDAVATSDFDYLQTFWSLVDELLNAILFFLLGLQLLVIPFEARLIGLWSAAILLVLAARVAVVTPWGFYFNMRQGERNAGLIMTWGGLHGALSLALALSVPPGPERALILSITFVVATFSVLVQGLTFTPLAA
jgi:CPA1 family monovalent cation:H+ antiporter